MLLNKYRQGDGIMPHADGPAYHPFVCILSLNSGLMLNIWENIDHVKEGKYRVRLYLEPRSLFIFTGSHYKDHLHGIEETTVDDLDNGSPVNNLHMTDLGNEHLKKIPRTDFRVSLTIRYVEPLLQ